MTHGLPGEPQEFKISSDEEESPEWRTITSRAKLRVHVCACVRVCVCPPTPLCTRREILQGFSGWCLSLGSGSQVQDSFHCRPIFPSSVFRVSSVANKVHIQNKRRDSTGMRRRAPNRGGPSTERLGTCSVPPQVQQGTCICASSQGLLCLSPVSDQAFRGGWDTVREYRAVSRAPLGGSASLFSLAAMLIFY